MNDNEMSFWRTHLDSTGGPRFHFISIGQMDVEYLKSVADKIGFAFFVIEAREIATEAALMDAFAISLSLPSYFGRNWDALLDLTRDLSWKKAKGYILWILDGDTLARLPNGSFRCLVEVLESTVRYWRDENREFDERSRSVPFHVIFFGGERLKNSLLNELREPFCEHTGKLFVEVFPAPVCLRKADVYLDAEKLVSSGADPELILSFLRQRGMNERDSMYSIAGLMGKTVTEARSLIYSSKTWPEIRERERQFRQVARDALEQLGGENS